MTVKTILGWSNKTIPTIKFSWPLNGLFYDLAMKVERNHENKETGSINSV